ncbi:MAG TPA: class IV adenylate cyclase [Planctomycetota bacterium]|nr:class IV adenylate cyclase [Planctomycetota bacterium]
MAQRKNIEIKARCDNLEKARQVALSLHAELLAEGEQTDTYFNSPQGRLKLRQSSFDDAATLVWYLRQDAPQPRPSEYRLARLKKPEKIVELFSVRFGVRGVVKKHRTVFLYDNVRIHLDDVENLGRFIELEAPVADGPAEALQVVDRLMDAFQIEKEDLVAGSYRDLLLE